MTVFKVYFTVTINGKEVHRVENTNPKIFTYVRVDAGDNLKPAADASYRNLSWENIQVDRSSNIGTKILYDRKIGFIDSLGPFFRVSFDLIIHKYPPKYVNSVMDFKNDIIGPWSLPNIFGVYLLRHETSPLTSPSGVIDSVPSNS